MKKIYGVIAGCMGVVLLFLGVYSLSMRFDSIPLTDENTIVMAAAMALPDGKYRESIEDNTAPNTDYRQDGTVPKVITSSEVYSENPQKYAEENQYPVIEKQIEGGDINYNNISIKNSTGFTLDVEKYLSNKLGFKCSDKDEVQVLIIHTHTSESYLTYDNGYYHESFYPRSSDNNKNMVRVGEEIKKALEQKGIGVVHATETHDSPQYDGAYYRSYDTTLKYLEKYPDIKVILDIHRDSLSSGSNGGKVKPTFTAGGKKAAQIMIMTGYDPDGSLDFPFWEENLTFALKLQQKCEDMYPGMTRPLYFGNFVYNMNVNNGSLLIEVGTDANTLEEAVYTGGLLGNVLSEVLQSE
ncbi:MAG: stage II sporulation protein P [Eubacteriales bacterium]|nr:stage II sporulation protein P [Eubacteriales bacterium]